MNRLLLVLCLSALTACAMVGSNDPATPLSPYERRTTTAVANDRDIENDIIEELNSNRDLQGQTHISVAAYNGAVLLAGEALTEELRTKIIGIAQVADNVKRVHNNIAIAYPGDLDSQAKDQKMVANIATALKQIRTLPNFDSSQVKVVVANATVYLMGIVHRSEGKVVINVVRLQPDVKQIITIFEYLD